MFGDEPIIGRYLAYISIFGFALIYQSLKHLQKDDDFISIVFLVIAEIIVFLSGERSPLFISDLIFNFYFSLYSSVSTVSHHRIFVFDINYFFYHPIKSYSKAKNGRPNSQSNVRNCSSFSTL
jgi:hypothetical protein